MSLPKPCGNRVPFLIPCQAYRHGPVIDDCADCGYSVLQHRQMCATDTASIVEGAMSCLLDSRGLPCYCAEPKPHGTRRDLHDRQCPHFLIFMLCDASYWDVTFTRDPSYLWVATAAVPRPGPREPQ